MSGLTDADLVGRFEAALDQEEYGLKPGDGAALAQMAVNFAHAKCATDPKLGNDVRAALAEGITIGAMAMRDVFRDAERWPSPGPVTTRRRRATAGCVTTAGSSVTRWGPPRSTS